MSIKRETVEGQDVVAVGTDIADVARVAIAFKTGAALTGLKQSIDSEVSLLCFAVGNLVENGISADGIVVLVRQMALQVENIIAGNPPLKLEQIDLRKYATARAKCGCGKEHGPVMGNATPGTCH